MKNQTVSEKSLSGGKKRPVGRVTGLLTAFALLFAMYVMNIPQADAAEPWDSALANVLTLHEQYTSVQQAVTTDKESIKLIHNRNTDALKSINTALQLLDQPHLNQLSSEAERVRQKHASLLEQYALLGKQSAAARKAKDTTSAMLLDLKRNKLKPVYTAAKAEIKSKADALAAARKQTAARKKLVRDCLTPITALKKQIATHNQQIAAAQKIRSEADKRLKAAIKQGDAVLAAAEMKTSTSQMLSIQSLQQKIYTLEKEISGVLQEAKKHLALS